MHLFIPFPTHLTLGAVVRDVCGNVGGVAGGTSPNAAGGGLHGVPGNPLRERTPAPSVTALSSTFHF
ncbi:hypothetical protein, partial [Nostoc sp. CHAB 5715]|uniref:hypothetical protein n=1 Tax=Nostoc sp. CHAB 5715 TaxID=2780400 RepID=UPI001E396BB9